MQVIEINAYAKVNLSLDIVGRREDGYHTVDMVMQSVSLCDRVRVALNDSGQIRLTCSKPHIPEDGRNTAFKAAQLFLDVTGLPFGAEIHILCISSPSTPQLTWGEESFYPFWSAV